MSSASRGFGVGHTCRLMTPRIHLDQPLSASRALALPPAQARHVQVLRLQPGDALILFNGGGGEWRAEVTRIGRSEVEVCIGAHVDVERELPHTITLALGMPANERMDALIEKATELGVAAIQPLLCERSVLRLSGERAERRREHWRAVAVAASEQSGRTRLPRIAAVLPLATWLRELPPAGVDERFVLSPHAALRFERGATGRTDDWPLLFLSGPEGGLGDTEETAACAAGFTPVSLGPRVLRADTAPLAVLAALGVFEPDRE